MKTGQIVDFYDDPTGMILKAKVAQADLPDFIKTAQYLDDQTRDKLPDDVFALVMIDDGQTFRKYACQDKGNAALSVLYFMETHDRLPEEAQKVAAANLLTACSWYDLEPPLQLYKLSGLPKYLREMTSVRGGITHIEQLPKDKRLRQLLYQHQAGRQGSGHFKGPFAEEFRETFPVGGPSKKPEGSIAERWHEARESLRKGKTKKSELTGSEIMPKSGPEKNADMSGTAPDVAPGKEEPEKLGAYRPERLTQLFAGKSRGGLRNIWEGASRAATRQGVGEGSPAHDVAQKAFKAWSEKKGSALQPYVDVTGKSAPLQMVEPQCERFCLEKGAEAFFPIDSYGQVKEAAAWFDQYHQSLHPADRHEYATKLAARADELDIKVSDLIKKYGSSTYAPSGEVNIAIHTRMQHWADDAPERDMLKGLMGKYASVQPDVFCEALRQFDEATGLDREWDETIYDPWYSTYGFTKQGEWVFSHAGERITSEQLRNFAKSERYCKIKHTFGDELADGLKKDPEKIFDSLPLDSKRIIMRLAADPQP